MSKGSAWPPGPACVRVRQSASVRGRLPTVIDAGRGQARQALAIRDASVRFVECSTDHHPP